MKYIRTAIAEQETTVNILYDEQIIKVYSSRLEVIKILTKQLGEPTIKYKKSKSYWSGASWNIEFNDLKKIEKFLVHKIFIDPNIEIKEKNKRKKSSKKNNEEKTNTKKIKEKIDVKELEINKKPSKKASVKKVEINKKDSKKVSVRKVKNNKENIKKVSSKKDTKKIGSKSSKKIVPKIENKKIKSIKSKKEKNEFEQFSLI